MLRFDAIPESVRDLLLHLADQPAIGDFALGGGTSLADLAAMKLNAIANRGAKKDFYDLVELLEHFTIQQLIQFFTDKYPSTDPFTVIRSLAWFEDAESEPDPVSLSGLTWDRVKVEISKSVAGL